MGRPKRCLFRGEPHVSTIPRITASTPSGKGLSLRRGASEWLVCFRLPTEQHSAVWAVLCLLLRLCAELLHEVQSDLAASGTAILILHGRSLRKHQL